MHTTVSKNGGEIEERVRERSKKMLALETGRGENGSKTKDIGTGKHCMTKPNHQPIYNQMFK